MKRYAFLDWPKPEPGDTPRAWHDDRCAVCGEEGRGVLDHDHDTALCRGFLCRGCNISEGKGSALFEDWRGDKDAMARVVARQREYVYPTRRAGGIVYPAPDEDLDAIAEAVTRGF